MIPIHFIILEVSELLNLPSNVCDFLTAYFFPPDSIDHQDEEAVESAEKSVAEASRCQFVSHIMLLNTPNLSLCHDLLKGILTSTILSPSTCTSRSRS